ncbi:MAG TPA: rhomboid family intramembrane serine protease [Clostridiales bacterium]|nr:rhomboid family intramembrane serine protease [Clostridiales bacterium]
MSDNWQNDHGKEYIEGEYEVIEERDLHDNYGRHYSYRPEHAVSIDTRPPYVTYAILGINIIVYLLMNLFGLLFFLNQSQQLLIFGAKENTLIAYGQYWRLFTAMFLHIGIFHLFFNSYALYVYGPVVERLFGKVKFAAVYIISGLTGSLLSYMFSPNPAAGASGAIFGLMGALLYFRQRKRDIFYRIFGTQLIMIIAFNLFFGFVNAGIDNWGHIGGLIGGFLVGNAVGLYKEPVLEGRKILIWLLIVLIFALGLWYGHEKYVYKVKPYIPRSRDVIEADILESGFALKPDKWTVTGHLRLDSQSFNLV